jgi:hypothetical protein
MRCLIDSLRQLLNSLPGHADLTTDGLVAFLLAALPENNEARPQLEGHAAVDVFTVLPEFTDVFPVRVQVFQHVTGDRDPGWPGDQTILTSDILHGPETDRDGNPTPILRLYWGGNHFEPVFPDATYQESQPPVGASSGALDEAIALRATADAIVRANLGDPPVSLGMYQELVEAVLVSLQSGGGDEDAAVSLVQELIAERRRRAAPPR